VGGPFGRKLVEDYIDKLKVSINDYYGTINENLLTHSSKPLPEKPEAMYIYENCKSMGIPLVSGGYNDQPHIWLIEWNIVKTQIELQERLAPKQMGDANASR